MNVNLPYEIGTVLKTIESGKVQYDKVHHYIVGNKIQVVLELCYETDSRLSTPIDIEELQRRWKKDNYVCSICGKRNVKLWRPYGDDVPLICAECAEKRQSPRECDEVIFWKELGTDYFCIEHTGRRLPLPKWKVNENGKIPAYFGPTIGGKTIIPMTVQLSVDLSDVSTAYSHGSTCMVPAYPNEDGNFWSYTAVTEETLKWWNELPTR